MQYFAELLRKPKVIWRQSYVPSITVQYNLNLNYVKNWSFAKFNVCLEILIMTLRPKFQFTIKEQILSNQNDVVLNINYYYYYHYYYYYYL